MFPCTNLAVKVRRSNALVFGTFTHSSESMTALHIFQGISGCHGQKPALRAYPGPVLPPTAYRVLGAPATLRARDATEAQVQLSPGLYKVIFRA